MTDNFESAQADPAKSSGPLLAGAIELTPEARAILTKQINRKIVWGYKVTKFVFYGLCGLPLLASAFFGYGVARGGVDNLSQGLLAIALVGGPAVVTWLLTRLVAKL